MVTPKKDVQTVTPEGERIANRIDGVEVRLAITHVDERGELCEIYNPVWDFAKGPFPYVYMTTLRPHKIRGWVVHREQQDRLFVALGALKIVLYDARPESPTFKVINEFYLGERNRGSVSIPQNVFHAVQNVGDVEGVFINCPTKPYNHANPDKLRLPLDTDEIPYKFGDNRGW